MADRRRLAASVTGALCGLVLSGCAGVPEGGAVTTVPPAGPVNAVADPIVQVAQPPAPGATPAAVIEALIDAMSTGDIGPVAGDFFTKDYLPKWLASEPDQTTVFSTPPILPTASKTPNQWSVQLAVSGIVDASGSYRRAGATTSVTFTFAQQAGAWLVSSVSQPGIFVLADSLPDVLSPVHIYYPSHRFSTAAVPRLVPDTVFLPVGADELTIVQQLLGGPSNWALPGVYVAAPTTTQARTIQPDPTDNTTTINLSAELVKLSGPRLATLEAQLAYTLADQGTQGLIQLEADGVKVGDPFSLKSLDPGYDPDGGSASSALYYVTAQDQLVKQTRSAQPDSSSDLPAVSDTQVPVIDHVDGVGQIAVGPLTDVDGTATQSVAGTRTDSGVVSLSLAALGAAGANPWTDLPFPGATRLSTPSFDIDGAAVWTVATLASGATTLYRVPLEDGLPAKPVAVSAADDSGTPLKAITAFRLSPDGERAAMVDAGHAYVGIVDESKTGFAIVGARPVISVDAGSPDIDVSWADRFNLGVVAQGDDAHGRPLPGDTTLYTVSADGYTETANGPVDSTTVAQTPPGAVQFAHAPNQLWVASSSGELSRQQTPDASAGDDVDIRPWDDLGPGTWPTYSD